MYHNRCHCNQKHNHNLCPCNVYHPCNFHNPCMHKCYHSNSNSNSNVGKQYAGTVTGLCDNTSHIVYDKWFPLPYYVEIWNNGDCPIDCNIEYTDGIYIKWITKTINPKESHKFDVIRSILTVEIVCGAIRENRTCCNSNADLCNVYWHMWWYA